MRSVVAVALLTLLPGCFTFLIGSVGASKAPDDEPSRAWYGEARITMGQHAHACRQRRIAVFQAASRAATTVERDRILGRLENCDDVEGIAVVRPDGRRSDDGEERSVISSAAVGLVLDLLLIGGVAYALSDESFYAGN